MHVNCFSDVEAYEAPKHHGMTAYRLQGGKAGDNEHFWCGLSMFLPGGGADWSGEVTVVTDTETVTLAALDSCRIAPNENRLIENRSRETAKMLVISATLGPGGNR